MGQSEILKGELRNCTRELEETEFQKTSFQDACTFGRGSLDGGIRIGAV